MIQTDSWQLNQEENVLEVRDRFKNSRENHRGITTTISVQNKHGTTGRVWKQALGAGYIQKGLKS